MLPLRTALLAVLLIVSTVRAAAPRDDVLRFVPNDIGFCVIVQDLRDTGKALLASPFAEQFANSAAGQALAKDPNLQQLVNLEAILKKEFGLGWDALRDDILGDAVVFVYRPGSADKPDETLMLIRARTEKPLNDLIARFNERQKTDGKLKKLEECKHRDVVYLRRVEEKETTHYFVRGPVLVFARDEKMLQDAIDADLALRDAEPPLSALLHQLGADKALFAVWINPRAFDADLNAKLDRLKKEKDPDADVLKMFLVYWRALDGLCISLTLERDLILAVGVKGRSESLPTAAQKFFSELSRPSALWTQAPEKPLLAVAGRFDFAAFIGVLDDFLTPDGRKTLRSDLNRTFFAATGIKDVVADLLPHVGKDVGVFVAAPADPKQLTPTGLFALRVENVEQALLGQLRFFANLYCLRHNQQSPNKPMELKTERLGKMELHYLDSLALPTALRPAFAMKDGFLLVAASTDAIRGFNSPAPAPEGTAPLVRVSFIAWHGYLKDRRDAFVKLYAEHEKIDAEVAASRLDGLLTALEFVDRMELRHETKKGQAIVTLTLKTVKPLRK